MPRPQQEQAASLHPSRPIAPLQNAKSAAGICAGQAQNTPNVSPPPSRPCCRRSVQIRDAAHLLAGQAGRHQHARLLHLVGEEAQLARHVVAALDLRRACAGQVGAPALAGVGRHRSGRGRAGQQDALCMPSQPTTRAAAAWPKTKLSGGPRSWRHSCPGETRRCLLQVLASALAPGWRRCAGRPTCRR